MASSQLPDVAAEFRQFGYTVLTDAVPQGHVQRWRQKALQLAPRFAHTISREAEGHLLSYRVVTGEVIREHWPELYEFYCAEATRGWLETITGAPRLYASPHLQSAINLNILEQPGHVYRWHFDAIPHTLILFLTDSKPEDGGWLEMIPNAKSLPVEDVAPEQKISVLPRAGSAVLMDGTRCCHRVSPLLRRRPRLSVPMVFPTRPETSRPEGLDDYLYRES